MILHRCKEQEWKYAGKLLSPHIKTYLQDLLNKEVVCGWMTYLLKPPPKQV